LIAVLPGSLAMMALNQSTLFHFLNDSVTFLTYHLC